MSSRSLSAYLLFIGMCIYCEALAQDTLLTAPVQLHLENIPLRQAIDTLSKQVNTGFAYDAGALPLDSLVRIDARETPLRQLLYQLLAAHDVDVSLFMGQIVISRSTRRQLSHEEQVRIWGTVTDADSGEPLPYVNISIPGEPVGTTTNAEGQYEFRLPAHYRGRPLTFSSIGYAPAHLAVPVADTLADLRLSTTDIRLPEVKVMAIPARVIINRMLANRHRNYLQSDVLLEAFFRETIRQDSQYVEVSEAVIDILKPAYTNNYQFEKVRFVKGRKSSTVAQMNLVKFRLQGGPYYFSRMDVARYLDFFPDKDAPEVYQYAFAGYDYQHGHTLYKIAFKPIDDNGELLYEGELAIDGESYALVAVDFRMTRPTLRQSRKYLIRKDTRQAKASPFFAIYHIDYRPFHDRWVLNRIKGEIKVRIRDRQQRLTSHFEAVTEMVVTDFRPADGQRLKYAETFKPDYVLSEKIDAFDADFWDNYNVIQPDEDLEKAMKKRF
ncbi:MAG: carboxypeptidase-like regulatory domain-containing protein [Marinilabiliaceae bacterium]|nr:carboxypeptidase-like regulatory domain-containing protein [Marinilabiliaceae bacterium]